MLPGIDLPLFRLRQVVGMDWRLMLCFIYGHMLVLCDGNISWIFRLSEVAGMVHQHLFSNRGMELDNLGII